MVEAVADDQRGGHIYDVSPVVVNSERRSADASSCVWDECRQCAAGGNAQPADDSWPAGDSDENSPVATMVSAAAIAEATIANGNQVIVRWIKPG